MGKELTKKEKLARIEELEKLNRTLTEDEKLELAELKAPVIEDEVVEEPIKE